MLTFVFSPRWFYGKDIIIDVFSIIVLSFVSYLAIKYHRLSKKKQHKLLSIGFALIAISFLFKIATNFTIYYHILETYQLGFFVFTYSKIKVSNILYHLGFFLYRFLMLFGLLAIYSVYIRTKRANLLIISYFIIILCYFSKNAYFLFHLTSLLFLLAISHSIFKVYTKNRHHSTQFLLISFVVITVSQLVFMFVNISLFLYVVAEIIQLLGYFALAVTLFKVLKDGKKKRA